MLPSPPTGVSAINTGTSILVTWQPPHDNPDVVVGYKVQYRKKGADVLNSVRIIFLCFCNKICPEDVEQASVFIYYCLCMRLFPIQ